MAEQDQTAEDTPPREQREEEQEKNADDVFELLTSATLNANQKKVIYDRLTQQQRERFECYIRIRLPRKSIRSVIIDTLEDVEGKVKVSDKVLMIMAGITKLFVAELVYIGREVMHEHAEEGAIRPVHLREAYRRLNRYRRIPGLTPRSSPFRR